MGGGVRRGWAKERLTTKGVVGRRGYNIDRIRNYNLYTRTHIHIHTHAMACTQDE